MSIFKTGVLLGRFQHIHIGHEKLINIGLKLCEKLLVFVGSADKNCTPRNPYDVLYRIKLIEKIYDEEIKSGKMIVLPINDITNENDLSPIWGEYVISKASEKLEQLPECIIYGKDKNIFKCFPKKVVKNITEILVDRNTLNISATEIREFLKNNDRTSWEKYTNVKIHNEYDNLRTKLLDMEVEKYE